ncbi:MAG TPA: FAD-dependent oxidoreductase, partial [Steroidobacteraceae bacterium]|nr:FAD-dependent oxidoreductase [Steroidobacteraceae bacterium]
MSQAFRLSRRRFLGTSVLAAAAAFPVARAWPAILSPTMSVDRDLDAVTGDGKSITLKRAEVQELGESLRGNLLLPGHAAYDPARRVWNAQMDKRPAFIVQPRGASDVRNAIQFARASNVLVAVKCGGHSPSGKSTCERGMLLDLSLLRGVQVDAAARIAHVPGGSLLGDLDHEAMSRGLVTTAGTVSHTGVGGLTLGGGFGRVARRFGLALDNVRAVEIVTGQGEILRASAQENPELYWGVRGGGGNFGVVTAFDFDLHPMQRQVIGGTIIFPL